VHAQEGKRIALIIGNNAYGLAPLRNAVNDAHIMDRALKAAGFTTIERDNVTKAGMEEAIAEFLQKLGRTIPRCSTMPATACRSRVRISWCRWISKLPPA